MPVIPFSETDQGAQPKALALDMAALGEALVKYFLISAQMGHEHVADMLRDYWHGDGLPAEDHFLHDLLAEDVETIERRWFGDQLAPVLAKRAASRGGWLEA